MTHTSTRHKTVGVSDCVLLDLGRRFDDSFEHFLRASKVAMATTAQCEARLAEFNVPFASARWIRLRQQACDDALDAMNAAAEAATDLSKQIKAAPASTIAGLMVKARCLPFDMSISCDQSTPRNEWDWDAECLYDFIDEVERLASRAGQ